MATVNLNELSGINVHCACGDTARIRIDGMELVADVASPDTMPSLVEQAEPR